MKKKDDVMYDESIMVYMETDMKVEIEKRAEVDDRTESSFVRMVLRRYLDGEFDARKQ